MKYVISSRCLEITLQCRVENQKKPGGCFYEICDFVKVFGNHPSVQSGKSKKTWRLFLNGI